MQNIKQALLFVFSETFAMFFVGSEAELLAFGTVVFIVQCHLKIELQLPPLIFLESTLS